VLTALGFALATALVLATGPNVAPYILISTLSFVDLAEAHSWYDENCCSGKDCHPVACDEISEERDGFHWHYGPHPGDELVFAYAKLHPSIDGTCHVCHQNLLDGNPSNPICIYLRQTS
jgi:hypothetical protein